MTYSPIKDTGTVVRCSVYSEGEKMPDSCRFISIEVNKAVNRIGKAMLVLEAGDMPAADIPESNDETYAPGKKIRIEAGYDNDEKPIFEGFVISHSVRVEEGNKCTLRIECCDYAFPSTLARNSKVFLKSKDSDAISTLLKGYSPLSVSVDSTLVKHAELVQYNCTDWDFVLSRAKANGLVVITEGSKIEVKKPDVSASPALKVKYGTDVIEFAGELSASQQFSTAIAMAWEPASQKIISAAGVKPTLNSQGDEDSAKLYKASGYKSCNLQTVSSEGADELKEWASSKLLLTGLSRIRGTVRFYGNSKAKVGSIIEIDGFGKRFNGNAYIGAVTHKIDEGNWTTLINMGLPEDEGYETTKSPSNTIAEILPTVQGLHVGKVAKLDGDPTNANRIQVELPMFGNNDNLIWARLSSFSASSGYGAFFIPNVGDEVVVGFLDDNPCYPVVLGSLHSSKQKPPCEITKENQTRTIVTKEKLKIILDDKDKSITLLTPGKNSIVVSDKEKGVKISDQNQNSIEMNQSGIVLKSSKGITLDCGTNLKLAAKTSIEAESKTDLKMKGLNVEIKSNVSTKIQGTASAELSASGQTIVKGAMVMIN